MAKKKSSKPKNVLLDKSLELLKDKLEKSIVSFVILEPCIVAKEISINVIDLSIIWLPSTLTGFFNIFCSNNWLANNAIYI